MTAMSFCMTTSSFSSRFNSGLPSSASRVRGRQQLRLLDQLPSERHHVLEQRAETVGGPLKAPDGDGERPFRQVDVQPEVLSDGAEEIIEVEGQAATPRDLRELVVREP